MHPKLLLADDSVTIQRVIELTFADEDVQVLAVGDGQQAIDRVKTRSSRHRAGRRRHARAGRLRSGRVHQGRPRARAHSRAAADRGVRADRRSSRARGRLRRRARQAVRAADGHQPRARSARRQARTRPLRESRPRRRDAGAGRLRPPSLPARSKTISTGSTPPSPARVRRSRRSIRCPARRRVPDMVPRPGLTVVKAARRHACASRRPGFDRLESVRDAGASRERRT